jgi:hypothetical protein
MSRGSSIQIRPRLKTSIVFRIVFVVLSNRIDLFFSPLPFQNKTNASPCKRREVIDYAVVLHQNRFVIVKGIS